MRLLFMIFIIIFFLGRQTRRERFRNKRKNYNCVIDYSKFTHSRFDFSITVVEENV